MALNEINGVQIFAAGKWNGDVYTEKDLDLMVEAFKETSSQIKPYVKLGHDDNQALVQNDGLPAAGWITNIYRVGKVLCADIKDIPTKIYELIKNKAYKRVSSEIYWNFKSGEKTYKRLLGAIALLGGNTPEVTCLDDILNLYGITPNNMIKYENNTDTHKYEIEGDLMDNEIKVENEVKEEIKVEVKEEKKEDFACKDEMANPIPPIAPEMKPEGEVEIKVEAPEAKPEPKVDEFQAQIDEMKKKLEAIMATLDAANKKNAELEVKAKEYEAKEIKAMAEKAEFEKESYLNELEKENLISKSSRNFVKELLEEKKSYSVEGKEVSKTELLKSIFKLHKAVFASVNFEENSVVEKTEPVQDKDIYEEYAKANNVSYKDAYLQIENNKNI